MTIRDLRNRGADVIARVLHGDSLTVTRDGAPVATLGPVPRAALSAQELIRRRRTLPRVDAAALRADLDDVLDPSL